jgi:hypothetical protein
MALTTIDMTGRSTTEIALQLRRMKRRLFLELVNGGSEGEWSQRLPWFPSSTLIESSMPSRSRLSRSDSNASGLFFSSRSIDSQSIGNENVEI